MPTFTELSTVFPLILSVINKLNLNLKFDFEKENDF